MLCLIAAVLVGACGDEQKPAAEPSSTTLQSTTTTTRPSTTTTPLTTTTTQSPPTTTPPTTAPEAPTGAGDLEIGRDMVWRDVFDALTPAEQACVTNAVGAELDWVLRQPILDEDDVGPQELAVLPCLPPQVVRAVFLAGMVLGMEDDGIQVTEEQEACLREVVGEMDVAALTSFLTSENGASDDAAGAEGAAQLFEMMAGLLRCLPELLDAGVEGPDDYADGVVGAARLVVGEAVEGGIDFQGDVDVFMFEATGGEVYEVEVDLGTLHDSVVAIADADGFPLDYNDDRGDGSLGSRIVWRAPESGDYYVEVSGFGEDSFSVGSYTLRLGLIDVVDDFGDGVEGAFGVALDESVEGVLDYPGDLDYFAFEATEGALYEIDVDLGTLSESFVIVYDAARFLLGYNDDRRDGFPAPRLLWRAPESGEFYVEVSGRGEGSYTLRLGLIDVVDDFGDGVEGAARIVLDESVEGVLDYDGDLDYFVFEAEEGDLYEMDVALGTLGDSVVAVYLDRWELGFNDDRGDGSLASRLLWRAPESGEFYVEVSGYGEGSYTLTVGVSDIVDDFADWVVGAARVGLGESVEGVLDYGGDVDYFVFEAVEGELYEVEVDLGTLADSVVEVYNADGHSLDYNDDRGDGSLASRLLWRAPESGEFYVEVSGYGEGSYVLMVAVSE
ncbi:MAG: pre-peptidase C-terminal domain-containing protein [bacterium]|nr:pre-peptidase C-terminal domain-containing protein [bacterium]